MSVLRPSLARVAAAVLCVLGLGGGLAFDAPRAAAAPTGDTSFRYVSEPNEGIGLGRSQTLTTDDVAFHVTEHDRGLRVVLAHAEQPSQHFWMEFEPRRGRALELGPHDATMAPSRVPAKAGMRVTSGNGCGSNQLVGRFDVRELVRGADGSIQRLAIDFVQRCVTALDPDPALFGQLRVNASAAFPPPPDHDGDGVVTTLDLCPYVPDPRQSDVDRDLVGDACDASSSRTWVDVATTRDGAPDGFSTRWYPDEAHITVSEDDDVLTVRVEDAAGDWTMDLAGRAGERVERGPYPDAGDHPWQSPMRFGIGLHGSASACSGSGGRFDVRDLVRDEDGTVVRLAVDFDVACEHTHGVRQHGQVRFEAPALLPPAPDDDVDLFPNTLDNCPRVPNLLQSDADRDAVGDACDPSHEVTYLAFDAEPDARLHAGDETVHRDQGRITVDRRSGEGVWARFYGGTEHTWDVELLAARGGTIGLGHYEASGDLAADGPRLLLRGSPGPACGGPGTFDVLALERSPDGGSIERFAASFERRCHDGGVVRGSVRFDAPSGLPPDDLAPPPPGPADPVLPPVVPPLDPLLDPVLDLLRLAGSDRVETAVTASRDAFPDGASAGAVVLSRSDGFADALAATPLAVAEGAPILLTPTAALDGRTLTEIDRVLPTGGVVHVLGGPTAIGPAVEATLRARGYEVVRHAGADRYATAVALADALGAPAKALLVTGRDFPDGLAAGAAAAHLGAAVLLTDGPVLPPSTFAWLASRPGTSVTAIGGAAAHALPSAARIVGADRYATALAVARQLFPPDVATVGLASGTAFPDALSGGAHVGRLGGPLLLARRDALAAAAATFALDPQRQRLVAYGGPAALVDQLLPGL